MPTTNAQSGTRVDEIAAGIYRIHTSVTEIPGGFSFNQYLVVDDEPLLFHTGPRRMASFVGEAIASLIPLAKLRHIAFSHVESDESGGMNELLAAAPHAQPVCSRVAAMVSGDLFDRAPNSLTDGAVLATGQRRFTWLDAPHVPHGWDNGYMFEATTRTLLCGDLFTQPGANTPAVTDGDILGPSEAFRGVMDYYSHTKRAKPVFDRLAGLGATTLACMHGSAWRGDTAAILRALGDAFGA
jgi:flavorubredoxin